MKRFLYFSLMVIGSVVFSLAAPGSATACGSMGSGSDLLIVNNGDGSDFGMASLDNITVEAEPGQTCFFATNLPDVIAIEAVRFKGPNGGEFDTFMEDPRVAAQFGPGYRAFSAVALTTIDLERFTLEIDYRLPSPNIPPPRVGAILVNIAIAAGQSTSAGQVVDHASILRVGRVEVRFDSP
jgi:hypothetical protein